MLLLSRQAQGISGLQLTKQYVLFVKNVYSLFDLFFVLFFSSYCESLNLFCNSPMGCSPQFEKYYFSEAMRYERGMGRRIRLVKRHGLARKSREALSAVHFISPVGIPANWEPYPSEMLSQFDLLHCW